VPESANVDDPHPQSLGSRDFLPAALAPRVTEAPSNAAGRRAIVKDLNDESVALHAERHGKISVEIVEGSTNGLFG
jgi:hypothetical protein